MRLRVAKTALLRLPNISERREQCKATLCAASPSSSPASPLEPYPVHDSTAGNAAELPVSEDTAPAPPGTDRRKSPPSLRRDGCGHREPIGRYPLQAHRPAAPMSPMSGSPCHSRSWRYRCEEPACGQPVDAGSGDAPCEYPSPATRREDLRLCCWEE